MSKISDAFADDEITKVEDTRGVMPARPRRETDGQIDRIVLQRPPGGTSVRFDGADALREAGLMLDAWAQKTKRNESGIVGFAIYFGDGLTYGGTVDVHRKHSRDLAARLRDPESFRAALCPDKSPREAAAMFQLFASHYQIGISPARARKAAASFGVVTA